VSAEQLIILAIGSLFFAERVREMLRGVKDLQEE
jgi:hypothetical protein